MFYLQKQLSLEEEENNIHKIIFTKIDNINTKIVNVLIKVMG